MSAGQGEESLTALVKQTPLEFHIHPVPIAEIRADQRYAGEQPGDKAWRFSISLEGREMTGYYFGGELTAEPTAASIIDNLLLTCYSTREASKITDARGGYGRDLRRVLGQKRLERFLAANWDV